MGWGGGGGVGEVFAVILLFPEVLTESFKKLFTLNICIALLTSFVFRGLTQITLGLV